MSLDPSDFTRLVRSAGTGDERAADELLPIVYDELRAYAARLLAKTPSAVLQPTVLVHEAYLKLVDQDRATYEDSFHFQAIAAQAMRRCLVDLARKSGAAKRGGDQAQVTLDTRALSPKSPPLDIVELNDAMETLAQDEPRAARVVELRFFGGLKIAEAAKILGVSTATADRDWRFARAWLFRQTQGRRHDSEIPPPRA